MNRYQGRGTYLNRIKATLSALNQGGGFNGAQPLPSPVVLMVRSHSPHMWF
ncbi:MAG: hypothetical protein J6W19_05100 [Prevotella sp.]|nr:hypothetical protein [Prevotella sp.]